MGLQFLGWLGGRGLVVASHLSLSINTKKNKINVLQPQLLLVGVGLLLTLSFYLDPPPLPLGTCQEAENEGY